MTSNSNQGSITKASLCARIGDSEGHAYEGVITDLSGGVATVQFWGKSLPHLALLSDLDLEMVSVQRALPKLPSKVRERREIQGGRVYRFSYELTPDFSDQVPKSLLAMLASRLQVRVTPPEGVVVEATLQARKDETVWPALLMDVSLGGVGLLLNNQADAQLFKADDVELTLYLKDDMGDEVFVNLIGRIRHRTASKAGVMYGIAFVFDTPDSSRDSLTQIGTWIDQVQKLNS